MADVFIAEANQLCEVKDPDHQLVNAALLYASARFSAFITASLSLLNSTNSGQLVANKFVNNFGAAKQGAKRNNTFRMISYCADNTRIFSFFSLFYAVSSRVGNFC
jgi:hypothetical protein